MRKYDFDIMGLMEIDLHWQLLPHKDQWEECSLGWWETGLHSTKAYNQEDESPMTMQPGGCMLLSTNKAKWKIMSNGRDFRNLGRWAWKDTEVKMNSLSGSFWCTDVVIIVFQQQSSVSNIAILISLMMHTIHVILCFRNYVMKLWNGRVKVIKLSSSWMQMNMFIQHKWNKWWTLLVSWSYYWKTSQISWLSTYLPKIFRPYWWHFYFWQLNYFSRRLFTIWRSTVGSSGTIYFCLL